MQPLEHTLTIVIGDETRTVRVSHGVNLRRTLLDMNVSPYAPLTRSLNCGGRGLCATCGVWVEQGETPPEHWHDRIGARFGYPRLSCQITITGDLRVRIMTEKWIWGRPDRKHRKTARRRSS
jgi:ferredoxin